MFAARVAALLFFAVAATMGCAAEEATAEDEITAEDESALKKGKVVVGIADSDHASFDGNDFRELGVRWARRVVPWNVGLLPKTCRVRVDFETYVEKAKQRGASIALMFGPDFGGDPRVCPPAPPGGGKEKRDRAPSVENFADAMRAFKGMPEYRAVKAIAAWNEPDYSPGVVLGDIGKPLNQAPLRAADYYVALDNICRDKLLLAGEFASNPASKEEWWIPYHRRIVERGAREPKVWSIHPTKDLTLFQADAADRIAKKSGHGKRCNRNETKGCVTKSFASWVATLPGNATVWLTETEASVTRVDDPHLGPVFTKLTVAQRENIQADAMRFLFEEVVKSEPNVTRVFVYPLRDHGGADAPKDAGLVDKVSGRRREAYGVVRRYVD